MMLMPGRGTTAARKTIRRGPSFGDEREIHAARRMCDTDDFRWLLAAGLQRLDKCLGMPGRPFASPAQIEGRRESTVTTPFQFLHQ